MISFHCNNCGRRLKIADQHAGRKGQCPRCGTSITVPAPTPASSGSISSSRVGMAAPAAAQPTPPAKKKRKGPRIPLVRPGSGRLEFEEMIDMTAMVDIVFFLLIFFMVTSFNSKQASIEMPVPTPQSKDSGKSARTVQDFDNDSDFIVVRIDQDDTVWVEESVAMTPTDVAAKVRQAMHGDARRLMVVGHPDASHGTAVMVMDAGHSVGIEDVRLAVKEEE